MPSDDVRPSEHYGASPKQGTIGRFMMERLCTEIGTCGVVNHRRCYSDHIALRATKKLARARRRTLWESLIATVLALRLRFAEDHVEMTFNDVRM